MNKLEQISIIRQALMPVMAEFEKRADAKDAQFTKVIDRTIEVLSKLDNQRVTINGLDSLLEDLRALAKRDAAQEVKVNVADHQTKVEIPELTELLKVLNKPVIKSVSIADYRPHDQDDKTQNTEYDGFVSPTGSWYIVRAQNGVQRYAAGSDNYEDAWDRRAKQSYDYLNKVMG